MSGNKGKSRNKRRLNPDCGTDREEARRARIHSPDEQQVTDGDKDGTSSGGSGRTKPVDGKRPVDNHLTEIKFDEGKYMKERSHLLMLLPEDVWDLVFEKLDDSPEVLENLSNSSLVFRTLLLPKRMQFLFPKVAEVMVKFYRKSPLRGYGFSKNEKCTSCSRRRCTYWYSDILTLRLVCRKWSTAIDDFCQNSSHHFKIGSEVINPPSDFMNVFHVAYFANVQQFLQHFDQTHGNNQVDRNPFVGREVYIRRIRCMGARNRNLEKWRQLLSLFEKYGRHVWYCTFDNWDTDMSRELHFYMKLRELLALMPNLKVLRVFASGCLSSLQEVQARQLTLENPFPTFPSLEVLHAKNLPKVTFLELLRSNRHLSKLEVGGENFTDLDLFTRSEPLLNLKQVALKYLITKGNRMNLKKNRVQPLCKLTLYIEERNWEIQRIFDLLSSKWSETLTHLILNFPHPKHGNRNNMQRTFSTAKLNLPHISNLKLRMHTYHNLDFLMPIRDTLEFLDIYVRTYSNWTTSELDKWKSLAGEAEAQQDIMFWGCSVPLETNLWSLFPKLQGIKYCEFPYAHGCDTINWSHTRAEWEIHMEMKSLKNDV